MILALFDLDRREVRICRAGHHNAIFSTNGEIKYLEARGIGLGLEQGPIFERELEEISHQVSSGGVFVSYSDGLTEAMNEQGGEFGDDRIHAVLRNAGSSSARDAQQSIIRSVQQFRGSAEQNDDLTLVIVKAL